MLTTHKLAILPSLLNQAYSDLSLQKYIPLPKHSRNLKTSTLRIIGGQWRGRKLHFTEVPGLRPTGDRIRETLFNWLTSTITNARCLDLFAGTGSLGLECLSRGAMQVWLLEKNTHAASMLARNLKLLDAENVQLLKTDSINWLRHQATDTIPAESIDIVFIDPPFADQLWQPAIEGLEAANILASNAYIYIETPHRQTISVSSNWALIHKKIAGQVCYRLYRRN